jgi:hypothetical protein
MLPPASGCARRVLWRVITGPACPGAGQEGCRAIQLSAEARWRGRAGRAPGALQWRRADQGDGGADLAEEPAAVADLAGGDVDLGSGFRRGGHLETSEERAVAVVSEADEDTLADSDAHRMRVLGGHHSEVESARSDSQRARAGGSGFLRCGCPPGAG